MPEHVAKEGAKAILEAFKNQFNETDTPDDFFAKMKDIAEKHGFAAETKAYKQNPDQYKGHVGDVSMVVRVAVAGRQNAPDMQSVMQIMGTEQVKARLDRCLVAL